MYKIISHGDGYTVTHNDYTIILSATRKPMTFKTYADAQAFVTIQIAADRRHGPRR